MFHTIEHVGARSDAIGILSSSYLPLIANDAVRTLAVTQAGDGADLSTSLFRRPLNMISLRSRLDRNPVARAFFTQVPEMIRDERVEVPGLQLGGGDD